MDKNYCIVCLTDIDIKEGCPDHKGANFIEKAVLDWAAYNGIKTDTERNRHAAIALYYGFVSCYMDLCQR